MRAVTYQGSPCRVCTGTLRYRSTGGCVRCQLKHAAKQKLIKKQKE